MNDENSEHGRFIYDPFLLSFDISKVNSNQDRKIKAILGRTWEQIACAGIPENADDTSRGTEYVVLRR